MSESEPNPGEAGSSEPQGDGQHWINEHLLEEGDPRLSYDPEDVEIRRQIREGRLIPPSLNTAGGMLARAAGEVQKDLQEAIPEEDVVGTDNPESPPQKTE